MQSVASGDIMICLQLQIKDLLIPRRRPLAPQRVFENDVLPQAPRPLELHPHCSEVASDLVGLAFIGEHCARDNFAVDVSNLVHGGSASCSYVPTQSFGWRKKGEQAGLSLNGA